MTSLVNRSAGALRRLSAILILASLVAAAPPTGAQTRGTSDPAGASAILTYAEGRTSSGWLPFELEGNVRIFIPATVNGRSVKVMLDSGASATVLDRRFVTALGLKTVGDLTAEGSGGSDQYGVVHGVVIRLGDLTIENSETVGVDLKKLESAIDHPLPMVLGGAAFERTVVDIDFANRRIAFRDPATFKRPDGMHAAPLIPAGDNRAIDIEVEGRPARMVFDLGNAWPTVLYPRFWDNSDFLKDRRVSSTLSGGWGGMHSEGLTRLRKVEIGGKVFRGVPSPLKGVRTEQERSGTLDGNLGMPLLSRFRLVVDFPHQEVLFGTPVDTRTPFESNTTGLALQRTSEGAKVLHVATASPAEKAGLKVGDVITRLWDPRTGKTLPLFDGWSRGPAGSEYHLTLQNGQSVVLQSAEFY